MSMRTGARGGFTLMEVLLVIVILGLLAGLAIFAFRGTLGGAEADTTAFKIQQVESALDRYYFAMKSYPDPDEQGLTALVEKPADEEIAEDWTGPYLTDSDALKDPWGNDLVYKLQEDPDTGEMKPIVYSRGPNGEDDSGEGDDIKAGAGDDEENQY